MWQASCGLEEARVRRGVRPVVCERLQLQQEEGTSSKYQHLSDRGAGIARGGKN